MNRGFGADLARKMTSRKPRALILVDVQVELGEKVAKELSSTGVKVVFKRVDLADMEQVQRMVNGTVEEFGQLDVRTTSQRVGDDWVS